MAENANLTQFKTVSGSRGPALISAQSAVVGADAVSSLLDISAAVVVKATPGKLARVTIQALGTAGAFVLNDVATTGAAAAANQIASIAFNATGVAAGIPIEFEWPCLVGIVVSAVTTGGVIAVSYV